MPDEYQRNIMRRTAATYEQLAALRNVKATITVNDITGHYEANGQDCGPSTFGLQDWLKAQPGYTP